MQIRYFIDRIKSAFEAIERLKMIEHVVLESLGPVEKFCALATSQQFTGDYEIWRTKRIHKILECFGLNWRGKRVIELGCGYGEIGAFFAALGAEVTCVDGRARHLVVAQTRYRDRKNIKFVQRNLDEDFSDLGRFDLVIHFGLLYHIKHTERNLANTASLADQIVLESEMIDSLDPQRIEVFEEDRSRHDTGIEGYGFRCSPFYIKEFFERRGFSVTIVADWWLNAGDHIYDWPHRNDGSSKKNMRRFFVISKPVSETLKDGDPVAVAGQR
jgi:2-polyprenyl-3-methyl-5-hydroxy-6-metoxy-1,4-benzoquinol methylase